MSKPLAYYSEDYRQARKKFLSVASKIEAEVLSYDHPYLGPNEERLSTDVAYLGPCDPEKMLILVCGVHGTEGFYGSALEIGLLDDPDLLTISKDIGLLFIHGINPYGFAHLTRETEGNVDLNRNFIDHKKVYPPNPLYDAFEDDIVSKKIGDFHHWPSMDIISQKATGPKSNPDDLFSGQYTDPNGLFFGGHQSTWSNKTFIQILEDFVPNVPEVVIIDLHTGYGDIDNLEIYSLFPGKSQEHKRVAELFSFEKTIPSPYKTSGSLIQAAIKALAPSHVLAAIIEKGSCTPSAIEPLREDRWLSLFGDVTSDEGKEIKKKLKEALCPSDEGWRNDAYTRGMKIIKQGLFYLLQGIVTQKITQ